MIASMALESGKVFNQATTTRVVVEADTVTVPWGEELYSPIQYHTLKIGGFSVTTKVKPGETTEDAMRRAYASADKIAREVFLQRRREYLQRIKDLDREIQDQRSGRLTPDTLHGG